MQQEANGSVFISFFHFLPAILNPNPNKFLAVS